MIKFSKIAMVALGIVAVSSANAVFYTTEASFLAATSGPNYIEDYSNFTFGSPLNGSQTTWVAPGANGFGFTASATGGLYSNVSAMSTNNANDPLIYTFTGNAVTAFGTRLANTDISGNIIPGTVTLLLSNNQTQSVTLTGGEAFIGWVDSVAITSATMSATGTQNNWIQADHTILGTAVPEPASMTALAIGALALLRRKRSK